MCSLIGLGWATVGGDVNSGFAKYDITKDEVREGDTHI